METAREPFEHPPAMEFRPAPFWFWNDDLQPDELRRQIAEMHAHGIGGFFMHARMGRLTPYMSDRWMECVRAAVDEAERRGMKAWIYDEDNWPSGYGGGIVNALGPDMLQQYLFCDEIPLDRNEGVPLFFPEETVAVFGGAKRDGRWSDLRRLTEKDFRAIVRNETDPGIERLLVFRCEVHDRERFFCPEVSTRGYVDILDEKVTRAFINHIHEAYAREVGDRFGTTIPGFFTDEPSYHELDWRHNVQRLPWTSALPDLFRKENGGDLIEQLPSLVAEVGDWFRVRLDYYRCLARLFAENFTRPLAEWCERHGLELTGHYIVEESLPGAAQCTGDPMLHYFYEHVPGIDHLGKDIDLGDFWSSARVLVKQPASVTHQFGKSRIMIETFAGGGWDFGLREQKWMGDWLYALGVNLLCQHAFHYSLRGYRKRDYPPSLSLQQPWWAAAEPLGLHFGRLGAMLTRGKREPELLVLHPLESRFGVHRVDGHPWTGDTLTGSFERITEELLSRQIDFDYGNEELMARHGNAGDGRIRIGEASYRVILAPHAHTWRGTTLDLLERFLESGGRILSVRPAATRVDGRESDRVGRILEKAIDLGEWDAEDFPERLAAAIDDALDPPFRIETDDPEEARSIVHQYRRDGDERILFLTSALRKPFRARIRVREAVFVERWETADGSISSVPAERVGDELAFELPFDDGLSHLLVLRSEASEASPDPRVLGRVVEKRVLVSEGQTVPAERLQPNVLILDAASLTLRKHPPGPRTFLLDLQEQMQRLPANFPCRLDFEWESDLEVDNAELLLEPLPGGSRILFNGEPADPSADSPSWIDVHLRRIPLPGPIRRGANRLTLEVRARPGIEIEPPYVAGDFGVELRGGEPPRIVPPPAMLALTGWETQGLPFYAGGIRFELETEPVGGGFWALEAEDLRGGWTVRVNGREAGTAGWRPFCVPLKDVSRTERNRIEVTVYNSLRNFYGPHHLGHEDRIDCLGPHSFFEKDHRVAEYRLKPAGILGEIRLVRLAVPAGRGS